MTTINVNPRRNERIIAGSAVVPYDFPILADTDIKVLQGGVELILNVQYTVTGVGVDAGGTVILLTNPVDGTEVVLLGKQAIKQDSAYGTEAFPPGRIQTDLNKRAIVEQQLAEMINRCFRLAESSLLDGPIVPNPAAIDLFLRVLTTNPLTVGWGTLAALAGAVGIPLALSNGGTGASYATRDELLAGLDIEPLGAAVSLTPSGGVVTLPNPLPSRLISLQGGDVSSISSTGVAPGTKLLVECAVGSNIFTHGVAGNNTAMMNNQSYTTTDGDLLFFYFDGAKWIEYHRVAAPNVTHLLEFWRGDGTWQPITILIPFGVSNGLVLTNNAVDPGNDVDVSAGDGFSDETDPTVRIQIYSAATMTKQLDATWAAGNNAGGRVSGQSLGDGIWYFYMFRRTAGATDFCFSNTTTFTLPDSGTQRVLIGAVVRVSGALQTIAGRMQRPVLTEFVSGDLAIASSTALAVPHGFGAKPKLAQLYAKNVTPEGGYSAGDEVPLCGTMSEANAGATSTTTLALDATNITVLTGASVLKFLRKDTAADLSITLANWKYVVRAWL